MQRQRKLPLEAVAPRAFEAKHVTALLRLVHEHIYIWYRPVAAVAAVAAVAPHDARTVLLSLPHSHHTHNEYPYCI
jgi:hypothetical protein